jgi:hypothetical protein
VRTLPTTMIQALARSKAMKAAIIATRARVGSRPSTVRRSPEAPDLRTLAICQRPTLFRYSTAGPAFANGTVKVVLP